MNKKKNKTKQSQKLYNIFAYMTKNTRPYKCVYLFKKYLYITII
jgi:hypothetical protein